MNYRVVCLSILVGCLQSGIGRTVFAEDLPNNQPLTNAPPDLSNPAPSRIDKEIPVQGAYLKMAPAWGYMVKSSTIPTDSNFPQLAGKSEMYGTGAQIDLTLGWEISDSLAIQGLGGFVSATGRRIDRVRALGLSYAGGGLRFGRPFGNRLFARLAPGLVYAYVNNNVEAATTSMAAHVVLGLDYYIHVRHFSIGADLLVLVPFSPLRGWLAVAPTVRYTF